MAAVKAQKRRRARQPARRGPAHAIAETAKLLHPVASDDASPRAAQQLALAKVLRSFATHAPRSAIPPDIKLSPRLRQTLDRLLVGDSEKQIARKLQVSPHTVHVYVKSLYRQFDVNSRGELLARFIQNESGLEA